MIHVKARTKLVHLLDEYSLAKPVRALNDQTWRKPSCEVPRLAMYLESGLKATAATPWLCSDRMAMGMSHVESVAVEKIRTRG